MDTRKTCREPRLTIRPHWPLVAPVMRPRGSYTPVPRDLDDIDGVMAWDSQLSGKANRCDLGGGELNSHSSESSRVRLAPLDLKDTEVMRVLQAQR